jgi:hypothetical protein
VGMISAWRHGYGITRSHNVSINPVFSDISQRDVDGIDMFPGRVEWCGHFEWRLCRRLKSDSASRRIRWGRRRVQDLHEILKDVDDGRFVRVEPAG